MSDVDKKEGLIFGFLRRDGFKIAFVFCLCTVFYGWIIVNSSGYSRLIDWNSVFIGFLFLFSIVLGVIYSSIGVFLFQLASVFFSFLLFFAIIFILSLSIAGPEFYMDLARSGKIYFLSDFIFDNNSIRMLYIVIFAGALGGMMEKLFGILEEFQMSFSSQYLVEVLGGIMMGSFVSFVLFSVLRAGIIQNVAINTFNPWGVAGVCCLSGFFSRKLISLASDRIESFSKESTTASLENQHAAGREDSSSSKLS